MIMSQITRTVWAGSRQSYKNILFSTRNISRSFPRHEKPPVSASSEAPHTSAHGNTINVTPFQKRALVWVKRYKSVDEIPDKVKESIVAAGMSKARIKASIYLMIATLIMAGVGAYSGKKAAARGESVFQQGLDFYKQIEDEASREREMKASKAPK